MSILSLVVFLLLICGVMYLCDYIFPGFIQPEARRLIWVVITVVVLVCLLVWALGMFGINLNGAMNWGPRIGSKS